MSVRIDLFLTTSVCIGAFSNITLQKGAGGMYQLGALKKHGYFFYFGWYGFCIHHICI